VRSPSRNGEIVLRGASPPSHTATSNRRARARHSILAPHSRAMTALAQAASAGRLATARACVPLSFPPSQVPAERPWSAPKACRDSATDAEATAKSANQGAKMGAAPGRLTAHMGAPWPPPLTPLPGSSPTACPPRGRHAPANGSKPAASAARQACPAVHGAWSMRGGSSFHAPTNARHCVSESSRFRDRTGRWRLKRSIAASREHAGAAFL
jgi:hypothetical protein